MKKITSGIFIGYDDKRIELPATFTPGQHLATCPECNDDMPQHDEPRSARASHVYSRFCFCMRCGYQWHEIFTVTAIAHLPDEEGEPMTVTERLESITHETQTHWPA